MFLVFVTFAFSEIEPVRLQKELQSAKKSIHVLIDSEFYDGMSSCLTVFTFCRWLISKDSSAALSVWSQKRVLFSNLPRALSFSTLYFTLNETEEGREQISMKVQQFFTIVDSYSPNLMKEVFANTSFNTSSADSFETLFDFVGLWAEKLNTFESLAKEEFFLKFDDLKAELKRSGELIKKYYRSFIKNAHNYGKQTAEKVKKITPIVMRKSEKIGKKTAKVVKKVKDTGLNLLKAGRDFFNGIAEAFEEGFQDDESSEELETTDQEDLKQDVRFENANPIDDEHIPNPNPNRHGAESYFTRKFEGRLPIKTLG